MWAAQCLFQMLEMETSNPPLLRKEAEYVSSILGFDPLLYLIWGPNSENFVLGEGWVHDQRVHDQPGERPEGGHVAFRLSASKHTLPHPRCHS